MEYNHKKIEEFGNVSGKRQTYFQLKILVNHIMF